MTFDRQINPTDTRKTRQAAKEFAERAARKPEEAIQAISTSAALPQNNSMNNGEPPSLYRAPAIAL